MYHSINNVCVNVLSILKKMAKNDDYFLNEIFFLILLMQKYQLLIKMHFSMIFCMFFET